MNYVIIGNSAAAIGAVEGIRQIDKKGLITIISDEKYHTYSRPLISYLLYGKTTEEKMKYRADSFYSDNNCKCIFDRKVVSIDAESKNIKLNDNSVIAYDKLLVATGSRPFVPPMGGLDTVKNKFSFMSLDDAKALEAAITPESRVLIVGAGLIGLKAAEGISNKVKSITVVDLADRILPSILDIDGSEMVQKHIESKGISFILSDSVSEFKETSAQLKSGKKVDFDILIVAVGVRPNTELVKEAGGNVGRGIITDNTQKTSLNDIYSAGDCCESFDITTGENKVLALLPNAYMQGETAGINMAGGNKPFEKAIPMNAIGFFGLHMITAGSYNGEEYTEKSEGIYKKLIFKDGLLKGYILIGDIARAGIYTSLIKEQVPVNEVNLDILKKRPQLLMFSRAVRKEKLGGIKSGI